MSNIVPIQDIERMATAVATSGLFGIKTKEQAIALMLIAQAEGLHPAIAARDYHIIQGRPALKADAMLARFQAAGGKVRWISMTDSKVSAVFSHPQGGEVQIEWTSEMVIRAKIANDMHKKYPRQMLRARVISEGVRTVYPIANSGIYTPEEVQDFTPQEEIKTVTGTVISQTDARPVLRETSMYSQDQFEKNFPAWQATIASGKKSAEDIIKIISTKGTLTEEQKDQIRLGNKQVEQPATQNPVDDEWTKEYEGAIS